MDSKNYIAELIASAIVFPDLLDADLQDSYGVKTPTELLKEMVDDPEEYNKLAEFIQEFNGLDETVNEKVEQAKN